MLAGRAIALTAAADPENRISIRLSDTGPTCSPRARSWAVIAATAAGLGPKRAANAPGLRYGP